ncbi:3-oxoacyl-[acyl-carrier-protein] reductase [Hujiaoplasma nucleasis]|uniref:3-oxoacyl-[acyl-carrier-protein] reductase n=1 Tax=Hujiaoplasma nucleasis TaxID=2725268 RepID=A0A7L6N3F6_9MOLU|nr:3-oxoacyl-[acyl-carrier-protein] reductase [Hujiaoplasma nucleasis]QLY40790.1 3-oxoacyl-[acyl-carrier-protein] reductase [Hujiaoplasma nucleasis]
MENKKTVLITGASRGIGKAIALAFAKENYNVVINYNHSEEKAKLLANEIQSLGGESLIVQANVSDFNQAQILIEKTIEKFGQIDVLINNSGITKDNLILRMKENDFDDVINVNLKGTWNMCKHVSKYLLKNRQGSIINISSVVALIGNPGQSNYVASKAGIIGLSKSLAKEFASRNVRVNTIAPGFIETEMTDQLSESVKEYYLKQIPLNRLGKAEDIADLCVFLASDKASYITGQTISVNGGML